MNDLYFPHKPFDLTEEESGKLESILTRNKKIKPSIVAATRKEGELNALITWNRGITSLYTHALFSPFHKGPAYGNTCKVPAFPIRFFHLFAGKQMTGSWGQACEVYNDFGDERLDYLYKNIGDKKEKLGRITVLQETNLDDVQRHFGGRPLQQIPLSGSDQFLSGHSFDDLKVRAYHVGADALFCYTPAVYSQFFQATPLKFV